MKFKYSDMYKLYQCWGEISEPIRLYIFAVSSPSFLLDEPNFLISEETTEDIRMRSVVAYASHLSWNNVTLVSRVFRFLVLA